MVFSTYLFLFLYLPLVLGIYWMLARMKNPVYQKLFLILASVVFIGYAGPVHLLWLLISGTLTYLCIYGMQKAGTGGVLKRILLVTGILVQVGILGYFKYYNFFAENIAAVFRYEYSLRTILLPLGISYYFFQEWMLLLAVYKGETRVNSLLSYVSYISFFPYRSSGPIADYESMAPQFETPAPRCYDAKQFCQGLYLLLVGLAKKLVLADTLAVFASNGLSLAAGEVSLPVAWITVMSYTFQLYFDFSGYSDMAVGVGAMFGFSLPQNFNSPYLSESCTVFWRRWHMSLGRALTKCVYIPLGGNRKGSLRTCLNIFTVMCVSGLWHGASWNFILWGVAYGVIQVFERLAAKQLERIPKGIRVFATFICVALLWVLFFTPDFPSAVEIYRGLFNFGNLSLSNLSFLTQDGIVSLPNFAAMALIAVYLTAGFVCCFCCKNAWDRAQNMVLDRRMLLLFCILAVLSFIHLSRLSTFIYVNF